MSMTPWAVPLTTADEIMRELRHGWLHARCGHSGHLWVTGARRNVVGLWLTLGAVPSEATHEVLWGPGFVVWTVI